MLSPGRARDGDFYETLCLYPDLESQKTGMRMDLQPPISLSFQVPPGLGTSTGGTAGGRKFRIAFIVPEDRRTGTYFRYHNLAIALRLIGHSVTVYSQSSENRLRPSREIRDGVLYVLSATVPGNRWMLPPTNPATFVRRLLTPVEVADVYHLFQPFPTAAITWMWLKKRRPGLFVYDWDDFWINDEFGLKHPKGFRAWWAALWISRLERKLPSICDLATTVSQPLAKLASEWKCPRTTVVYNGVWPQARQEKQAARAALDLRQEAFYVGLMGWTGEIDWCLEAIRRCADLFPNLRLAITGLDPGKKLAPYSDILSRIDYLGVLPDDKFALFNPSLDLGLVPMRASDFNRYRLPFKLTDHLAGAVPVLCSRIGEASILADEFDGIFTCQPTLESWLDAFQKTVQKLRSATDDSRPSPEALLKRFSWIRIARELSESYYAALTSPRGRRADPTPAQAPNENGRL